MCAFIAYNSLAARGIDPIDGEQPPGDLVLSEQTEMYLKYLEKLAGECQLLGIDHFRPPGMRDESVKNVTLAAEQVPLWRGARRPVILESASIPGSYFDNAVNFKYVAKQKAEGMATTSACRILLRGSDYRQMRALPLVQARPEDGSAPLLKPDDQLSLIGVVTPRLPGNSWQRVKKSLFNPYTLQAVRQPLETYGGYYHPLVSGHRRRLNQLARHYGFSGLCYQYHWAGCNTSPHPPAHSDLLTAMRRDRLKHLPFCLMWASETRKGPKGKKVTTCQRMSASSCWRRQFEWLLPFLHNENYIKVDGKPMLVIGTLSCLSSTKQQQLLSTWREMALEGGLQGLHIIHTLSSGSDDDGIVLRHVDGLVEYSPLSERRRPPPWPPSSEQGASICGPPRKHTVQYRGERIRWPSMGTEGGASWHRDSPVHVASRLEARMSIARADPNRPHSDFFFVNAWNDWQHANALEPDNVYGYGNLNAVASAYIRSRKLILLGKADLNLGKQNVSEDKESHEHALSQELRQAAEVATSKEVARAFQRMERHFRSCGLIFDAGAYESLNQLPSNMTQIGISLQYLHLKTVGFAAGFEFSFHAGPRVLNSSFPCTWLTAGPLDKVMILYAIDAGVLE